MAAGARISVEKYLKTVYQPDCDYVDGRIEERNLGEWDHADLQSAVVTFFRNRSKQWGIRAVVEQRVRVSATRYRIPDVCVILGSPEQILTKPPFLCIEILSPDDRLSRVRERLKDFLDMGVQYVWVLDPETRTAYSMTAAEGLREIKSGILKTENPAIEITLAELFEA